MTKSLYRVSLALSSALIACGPTMPQKDDPNTDIDNALANLPDARVLMTTADGVPTYIVGTLAQGMNAQAQDATEADHALRSMLDPITATMRLSPDDLVLRKRNIDEDGNSHFRYTQQFNGLPVIGGDVVIHVDVKGAIYGINGSARGDISTELGAHPISQQTALNTITSNPDFFNLAAGINREVYIQTQDGKIFKAYEATVHGMKGADPVRDLLYVDEDTGSVVADLPQIHKAENRKIYTASNGTNLPGTLKRSEGGAASSDVDINGAYDGTGATYEMYKFFFNRDSYDNAGATLISSVHYDQNYCNAYWDGTQMVYGDGDASQGCQPLARAQDVTGHELTHAVTERESNLQYSGESGGMNESMSDVFGSASEAYVDGGKTGTLAVSSNTWLIGEKVIAPALRWMCDPATDGQSADFYSSSVGNLDVHYSSGLGNLAFCLLSQGGTHPRNKSTTVVPALGMEKALRIWYKANTDILTSTSNYATFRTATTQAAQQLGYDQATQDAVGCAWAAIGVGTAPASCGGSGGGGGGGGGGGDGTLTNGTPITGISGAKGSQAFWSITVPAGQTTLTITTSGGSGDADLYVQSGTKPTLSSYTCRPYINGNAETCTITNPAAGTWWVMLNGYAAYSGLTLTGTYAASGGGGGGGTCGTGDPCLTNGVPVTNIAGATSSKQYWRINTPAGKTLKVTISGGSGDADLYTRFGSRPTTSTYDCRPYLTGNSESCTTSNTKSGDYYVMLRGYQTFSGVSLVASY